MRTTRTGLTVLLACLVIFALAPAAVAQLPSDAIGGIGDPLGGGSGGSGGGVGDVVGGIGDTIGGEDGSSASDGTPDESDSELIDDLTNELNDTVADPETNVDETTQDPAGSVGGTIGNTGNAASNDVNDISKGLTSPGGKGGKEKSHKAGVTSGSGQLAAAAAGRNHDKVFAASLAARRADAKNRTPSTLSSATTSVGDAASGVIQTIGRVAAEAAQQAAFPLLLTLLVGAFLIGQNRIDSRDPKLALAPRDSDQDLLSFT